mmetsp:Transcript_10639/g.19692  ORF Transcript_10639/g.19692 Transcript_10639/m.19692 type:complete len:195 (-) Transcript_10639:87-671(-)
MMCCRLSVLAVVLLPVAMAKFNLENSSSGDSGSGDSMDDSSSYEWGDWTVSHSTMMAWQWILVGVLAFCCFCCVCGGCGFGFYSVASRKNLRGKKGKRGVNSYDRYLDTDPSYEAQALSQGTFSGEYPYGAQGAYQQGQYQQGGYYSYSGGAPSEAYMGTMGTTGGYSTASYGGGYTGGYTGGQYAGGYGPIVY